jgi:organic radical activating enzyme
MTDRIPQFYNTEKPDDKKWDADADVYQNADLIVQTTDKCNKNCPGCYLAQNNVIKNNLSENDYLNSINKLKAGQIVALRGGETTMIKNWFEQFVIPALDNKLKVILETNGYFIGTNDYKDVLDKIAKENIFTRISFDPMHIIANDKDREFEKMSLFAKDAEENKINFGFYSLDLDKEQIMDFIKNTPLESYINRFHSLIKYDDISELKIKGKYLKANGEVLDRINV